MKKCLLFIISVYITLSSFQTFSQTIFSLPKGFHAYTNSDEKEVRCEGDFDNDNKKDLAILCINQDETQVIAVVYLTSRYEIDKIYSWFPLDADMINEFTFDDHILAITETAGFGSNYTLSLKFKYFKDLKNMRLITYDSSINFGEMHSINLLTGEYKVNGKSGMTNFSTITLSAIEKYLEYLSSFTGN